MRILIAGHTGLPFGGIATYCESLLNSSLSQQVDLYFVETSRGGRDVSSRGNWGVRDAISALENILRFLCVYLRIRPHVVHIMTADMPSMLKHGLMLFLARSLGARVIMQVHCGVSAMFPPDGKWNWFSEIALRRSHGILVLSREWLNITERLGSTPTHFIPNGIHLEPYLALSRSATKNSAEPVHILYLGHLGEQKGTFDLIEAASLLNSKGFIIELIGEPFNANTLKMIMEQIDKYHLRHVIKVSPPKFGDEKLALFACADIFVLPSYSEGMPITIIESMAAGLPIIATTVGGITNMLAHEKTGLLVPPANPVALARALDMLIHSSEARFQMGSFAREMAQSTYQIEHIVPQLLEFYLYVESKP